MGLNYTAALGMALAVLAPSAGAQAQQKYNGTWSVEVVTERGECDRAYRYPVAVQNGRVSYAGTAAFEINGRVAANGAVQGSIVAPGGRGRANVRGKLDDRWGTGTWVASGTMNCSGKWVAERRG